MTRQSANNSIDDAETVGLPDQDEAVDVKHCQACASVVRPRDRYCRRCSASQMPSLTEPLAERVADESRATYATAPLPRPATEDDPYHRVSGSLVKAIAVGLSSSASARLDSRYTRHAVLALISIPIWLIIVLLSPLDAYATARTVIRQ